MRTIGSSGTYTDVVTAASSTATQYSSLLVPQPTLAAKNTGVITPLASSLSIQGPPLTGSNQTITNSYSFNVQTGQSRFSGPIVLSQTNISNAVSLVSASGMVANYTLTLPTSAPTTTGQALISDTTGNLSWGNSGAATQSTFSGANNVTVPSSVVGLIVTFSPSTIPVYVYVNATSKLAAVYILTVYFNPNVNTYMIETMTAGDDAAIVFRVNASGQILYTSGSYPGFSALTFTWYSPTTVASATSSLSLQSSLSVGTSSSFATGSISGTPSSTIGNLLNVNSAVFTDTSTAASSTVSSFNGTFVGAPTLRATNASVTTGAASTFTISGSPVAGTNETITNAYSLNVLSGLSNFSGPVQFPGGIYDNGISNQSLPQVRSSAGFYVPSGTTNVAVNSSYNIANIVRNAAGTFTVNFIRPLKNANYVVTTGFQRVGTSDFLNVFSPSTTAFGIELWSAGALKDPTSPSGIMFTIFL